MTKNIFVTIAGRANAGKSSLLNALVGEKIAAVSDKPQTTRTKITGVLTKGETQFVFMDTPGMHKARNKLSEHMVNTVNETITGVDMIIFMCDCTKKISDNEKSLIESFKGGRSKVILALNKIDLMVSKEGGYLVMQSGTVNVTAGGDAIAGIFRGQSGGAFLPHAFHEFYVGVQVWEKHI